MEVRLKAGWHGDAWDDFSFKQKRPTAKVNALSGVNYDCQIAVKQQGSSGRGGGGGGGGVQRDCVRGPRLNIDDHLLRVLYRDTSSPSIRLTVMSANDLYLALDRLLYYFCK